MARNPTAAQRAALAALLEKYGPLIRDAFEAAIYRARARADIGGLIDALERGDVNGAVEMLRMDHGDFSALREAVRQTYMAAGEDVRYMLPRAIVATYGFDGSNQRARAWLEQHGAALVQGITEDSRTATQRAILDVLESRQERGLRSAALDITGRIAEVGPLKGQRVGGIIGLTSEMTDETINARAILSNPDRLREYFTIDRETGKLKPGRYKRIDKRFLRTVYSAWKNDRALTSAEIKRGMTQHKNKLLKVRGDMIAQHEAFQAQASSREEAMAQVLERPDVEDVTRRWQLGFPREHRQNHVALADKVISFNERFDLGNGITARCPHDEDLPISETGGCRCSCVYRVKLRRGV